MEYVAADRWQVGALVSVYSVIAAKPLALPFSLDVQFYLITTSRVEQ